MVQNHTGFVQYCCMIFFKKVRVAGGRFLSPVVMVICPGAFKLCGTFYCFGRLGGATTLSLNWVSFWRIVNLLLVDSTFVLILLMGKAYYSRLNST